MGPESPEWLHCQGCSLEERTGSWAHPAPSAGAAKCTLSGVAGSVHLNSARGSRGSREGVLRNRKKELPIS